MSLTDPELVQREYASENRLLDRRSIYEGSEGPDAREVVWRHSQSHLHELWELVGGHLSYSFSAKNAGSALRAHFESVEIEMVEGWVTFGGTAAVREYVAASIVCRNLVERVPELSGPLRARRRNAVFVAEQAA